MALMPGSPKTMFSVGYSPGMRLADEGESRGWAGEVQISARYPASHV